MDLSKESGAFMPGVTSVVDCMKCPRLRKYCAKVGIEKRAAFRDETYWARPVPGFGDPHARIVLIGLAPAAHGANRTGRMFTGDGARGSSDFLMRALYANGLASQPTSQRADDGLMLTDVWITAVIRCAPPNNRPLPTEIRRCQPHLRADIDALPNVRVYVALGRVAFEACGRLVASAGLAVPAPRPFAHGAVFPVEGGPTVIASYHPSRQNTQTGRLTPPMLASVFAVAKRLAAGPAERRTRSAD